MDITPSQKGDDEMGYAAKWKALEDLMLELGKKGYETPASIISDLRNTKIMIKIIDTEDSMGDTTIKLEEVLGSIQSDLITEAQQRLSPHEIDEWLNRIAETSVPTFETRIENKNIFITGVPKDQQWIRIEPIPNMSAEWLSETAKENNLTVKGQKDGRIVVYGHQESIKLFLKKMTAEAQPKNTAAR